MLPVLLECVRKIIFINTYHCSATNRRVFCFARVKISRYLYFPTRLQSFHSYSNVYYNLGIWNLFIQVARFSDLGPSKFVFSLTSLFSIDVAFFFFYLSICLSFSGRPPLYDTTTTTILFVYFFFFLYNFLYFRFHHFYSSQVGKIIDKAHLFPLGLIDEGNRVWLLSKMLVVVDPTDPTNAKLHRTTQPCGAHTHIYTHTTHSRSDSGHNSLRRENDARSPQGYTHG